MGKIFCNVCGADYPDTEKQCPICGEARLDAAASADNTSTADGYAYVKGGRFSKSNVKKHNDNRELPRVTAEPEPEKPKREKPVKQEKTKNEKPKQEKPAKPEKTKKEKSAREPKPAEAETMSRAQQRAQRREREDEPRNNIGLIILAFLLVAAIVAMCVFLVMEAIDRQKPDPTNPTGTVQGGNPTDPNGTTGIQGPVSIPCVDLHLPVPEFTFTNAGDTLQIVPVVTPKDTTEKVLYISSDERIATVDEKGIVTAVADGEAIIYVYCGSFKKELRVVCQVGVQPTDPTEPGGTTTPTGPTEPPVELKLNRTDFTLTGYGSTWNLYSGELDPAEIVWSSSNEAVATVENGKVTAVGNGKATITAEYMDQVATCIVRCSNVEQPVNTQYEVRTIYGLASDITLRVGESLTLQLVDKESGLRVNAAELTFTVAKEGYVTVDANGRVTAQAPIGGGVYVYIEYEGVTYKCLIRVRAAE